MDSSATMVVHVDARGDVDEEELEELTSQLRRELEQLDVDEVERPVVGEAPEGTRALDVLALGTLVVKLVQSAQPLREVVQTVRRWLGNQPNNSSVRIEMDGDSLQLSSVSSAEKDKLINAWIERHSK
jgi:2-keto-3-deoxy-L-rhamnonate aldolase RhmA